MGVYHKNTAYGSTSLLIYRGTANEDFVKNMDDKESLLTNTNERVNIPSLTVF